MPIENYDPSKPVCDNQDDFNQALQQAIKYNNKQEVNNNKASIIIYFILYVIFLFWALTLAMKVQDKEMRTAHVTFALVFGPIYVLGYYCSNMAMRN
jgi:uncharacterized ion transporter superfamily protein YfcC